MSKLNAAEDIPLYMRAARYVLQYKDNTIVRFAAAEKGAKKFQTRVTNLSETGLAFLLPLVDNPKMDDTIKVEFQVPNQNAMACFAKVVRVQKKIIYDEMKNRVELKLVAVKFLDLPVTQMQMIRSGLQEEFEKQKKEYQKRQMQLKFYWAVNNTPEALRQAKIWVSSKLKNLFSPPK